MSDDIALSRRQLLAALGVTGASAAAAGVGTSALFTDDESFGNNSVVAGTLDARVAWTERYARPGDAGVDVRWEDGASLVDAARVGLPTQSEAVVSVPDRTAARSLLNAAVDDVYPSGYDADGSIPDPCDPTSPLGDADGSPPVVDVSDLKPGDVGLVSVDVALCSNPGYVRLRGNVRSADERGVTEPERDAPGEDGDADSTDPGDVELLDAVRAAVWVDDGDAVVDDGESPAVLGSLRSVLAVLSSGDSLPLDGDGDDAGDGVACFTAGTTHSVVLAWWLPREAGNAVQSDSATFDLSVRVEQCRNNDAPAARGGVLPGSTLTAPDGDAGDAFGTSLAADGGTLAVGAPGGSVYLFEAVEAGWSHAATLDTDADDDFGASVAVRGDVLLVGAPRGNRAHLYRREGAETSAESAGSTESPSTEWAHAATLEPSSAPPSFARESVALGDGVAAVSGSDAAYLYALSDATGTVEETDRLVAAGDLPAAGLAIDGTTLAVGSPAVSTLRAGGPGRVTVVDGSDGWTESDRTVAARLSTDRFDNVGSSLALDGDTLLVGASYDAETGTVLVYERDGTAWSRTARVAPDDAAERFGAAVSLARGDAVAGAPGTDSAYALGRDGGAWSDAPARRLFAATGGDVDFGEAVAMAGSELVGAPGAEADVGAVYGFGR